MYKQIAARLLKHVLKRRRMVDTISGNIIATENEMPVVRCNTVMAWGDGIGKRH